MPAPTTVPEFLDLVRRSALLPEARFEEVLARFRGAGNLPSSIDQAASLLVRDSLLTFFQAKQLKLGRYKRFTIGSKYRLLELIGAGGMGAVYLCEHTLMRRLVALKVLPVEKLEDRSNEERFYREARAVAALDHPNIVRAYDIDHYERLHFIVMEYVDGTSLQEIVARYVMEKKAFDPVRVAHYIAQSAIGMQHGHELGMVHRDIKPGNLLLDRSGVIKVLDMGLARFFNKQQDSVTEKYDDKCVLGTADYLAPEQAVSNVVDIRADIYALGGTMYFMLTGQTPFPDGTIASKLVAHQTREPRPVETFRSDVPPGMLAVLRKMMAKDPNDRYQEPIEVADALAEWADLPIMLPPTREMPIHCPQVQALAGPNGSGSGSGSPLARALFGPGRGVFARSPGSSGALRAKSKAGTGNYTPLSGTGSDPKLNTRDSGPVPVPPGPVSTARASTSPTAPLPPRPESGIEHEPATVPSGPGSGSNVIVVHAHRTWLFIIIGVLAALLFIVAALAAYHIGKGGNRPTAPTSLDPGKSSPDDNALTPSATDHQITPALTRDHIGQIETVEFRVAGVSGTGDLDLNSEFDENDPKNFAVRIAASDFTTGNEAALRAQETRNLEGKTIRARGRIQRDEDTGLTLLKIRSVNQIVTVGSR